MMVLGTTAAICQELRTTRLEVSPPAWSGASGAFVGTRSTMPLVLGTASMIPQPVQIQVGSLGSLRSLEVSGAGETWLRGPVAIGAMTGTVPGTMVRIASITQEGGRGLDVDLTGTQHSTGIAIRMVGTSGSEHAGMTISSLQNGIGTGIRLGGPSGTRPTLATAIDVTGGTGLLYNALTAGSGTAIRIGGTTAPQRGVDITVSGEDHVGVYAQGNTNGTALVGSVVSAAYASIAPRARTGVMGVAATNSSATSDTLVGVWGGSRRGGSGSKAMTSIGVLATAHHETTSHGGIAIGLKAEAVSLAPGTATAVGALLSAVPGAIALAVTDGSVYLGSSPQDRPPELQWLPGSGQTVTHAYSMRTSGARYRTGTTTIAAAAGPSGAVPVGEGEVVILRGNVIQSVVQGLAGGRHGREVILLATDYPVEFEHASIVVGAEESFLFPLGQNILVPIDGALTVWYDGDAQRWRCLSRSW